MKYKVLLLPVVALFSAHVSAQSIDITKLDPDIVAAASCSGLISGSALINYDSGVYNESRTKDMYYASLLYYLSEFYSKAGYEHFQEYAKQYDTFLEGAFNEFMANEFDWETQGEVDKCTARMVSTLTSPFPEPLQSQEARDELRKNTDERFEALLRINEAMQ